MAELADAQDLKSCGKRFPYRFDPGLRHQIIPIINLVGIIFLRKNNRQAFNIGLPVIKYSFGEADLLYKIILQMSDISPVY